MQIRSFIALELAPEAYKCLNAQLCEWQQAYPRGINWVRPENLHLTLLFIGDTELDKLPELRQMLVQVCREYQPFELSLAGFELFPAKQPRMVWAQLKAAKNELGKLNRRLLFETLNLGLQPDPKELRLHITMGRIKSSQNPDTERSIISAGVNSSPLLYDTICLYQSVLKPDGPVYTVIEQIKL